MSLNKFKTDEEIKAYMAGVQRGLEFAGEMFLSQLPLELKAEYLLKVNNHIAEQWEIKNKGKT